jgi:hypothetical protein
MSENKRDTEAKMVLTPDQIRAGECMAKINNILKQYGMVLIPLFHFDGQHLDARCSLAKRPDNQMTGDIVGGVK